MHVTRDLDLFGDRQLPHPLPDGFQSRHVPTLSGPRASSSSASILRTGCRDSIAANPKALAEFKAGKDTAINAFKGPVMKAAKGKANPKLVDETLRRLLAASG
jgi:GatB domain